MAVPDRQQALNREGPLRGLYPHGTLAKKGNPASAGFFLCNVVREAPAQIFGRGVYGETLNRAPPRQYPDDLFAFGQLLRCRLAHGVADSPMAVRAPQLCDGAVQLRNLLARLH